MVEVAGDFGLTLFAVGSVPHGKAALHAGLPGPRVDSVFAAHVAFPTGRGRFGISAFVCCLAVRWRWTGLEVHGIRVFHLVLVWRGVGGNGGVSKAR